MRRVVCLILAVVMVFSLFAVVIFSMNTYAKESDEMRGVWVASVYNIDFPSKQNLTSAQMKSELDDIVKTAKEAELNTIFFQVRPCADSLYKSSYFPWSVYLTGTQGKAPDSSFDPLDYIIKKAHENNIELHAWINPYRILKGTAEKPNNDINTLSDSHIAKKHPEYTVKYADGGLYFNPGLPEVRQLIIDSALEIVKNYDVDGLHMDDYFYPSKTTYTDENGVKREAVFDDSEAYKKYGNGKSLDDFRRDSVNKLVKELYTQVKKARKDCSFGISPFAIWANASNNPEGSNTRGGESYYDHYADTKYWVKNKMLDYIAPQIYWPIGYEIAEYKTICDWWEKVCSTTGVKLYIGHAAYKFGTTDIWKDKNEIKNQLDYARSKSTYGGSIYYGYSNIKENFFDIKNILKNYYSQISTPQGEKPSADAVLPPSKPFSPDFETDSGTVYISQPANGYTTTSKNVGIIGLCDKNYDLTVNGEKIETTKSGFFGYYPELSIGENIFVFKNGSKSYTYKIYRKNAASSAPLSSVSIVEDSMYPQSDMIFYTGEKIKLSAMAPANSSVNAVCDGVSVNLVQKEAVKDGNEMYPVLYEGEYTLPLYDGKEYIDLGKITYTVSKNGQTNSKTTQGQIKIIPENMYLLGKISTDNVIVKPIATSKTFPEEVPVNSGYCDLITGKEGNYYRFQNGGYIHQENVEIISATDENVKATMLSCKSEISGENIVLSFELSNNIPYKINFDAGTAYIKLSNLNMGKTKMLSLIQNDIISLNSMKRDNDGNIVYEFIYSNKYQGVESRYENNTLKIIFKGKKGLSSTEGKPLSDIKIHLDAGHGGDDSGAVSPAGKYGDNEKDVNLKITLKLKAKLEEMGAAVTLSRADDTFFELSERTKMARDNKADLFVSLHHNSVGIEDSPFASGLKIFYTVPYSMNIANSILQGLSSNVTAMETKDIRYQNFAVARDYYCPAVLCELGFICNPNEYENIIDDNVQNTVAQGIAQGILNYYVQ